MKLKLALAAFATLAFAGVAHADQVVQVKLQTPVAKAEKVIANGAVFNCVDDTCTAVVRKSLSAKGCAQLTRKVGAVQSFGGEDKTLDEAALAVCNAAAKPAKTPAQNATTVAQQ